MAAAAAALPDFTAAQIRALSSRLAEPGLDALFKAARREAQRVNRKPPSREQVRAAVATVSTPQVYGRRPHAGTVAAAAVNEKWQVDIISFQSFSAVKANRGYFGVLLAIDVASRKLRGTTLQSRDGPTIRAAFERLFAQGRPKIIDSDFEPAFRGPEVTDLMQQRQIAVQMKDPNDIGAIVLIDRAGGQMKQAMFRLLQSRNTSVWINGAVDDVLRALNERPHEALGGAQPRDVAGNEHLQHVLLQANTAKLERNHAAFTRMRRGLEVGDKFRAPLKRAQRGFQRASAAQYSSQVFTVGAILQQGRQVRAQEDDKTYSSKLVLPVAAGSEAGGRALAVAQQRRTAQVQGQRGAG
jgi:hypothetical protein